MADDNNKTPEELERENELSAINNKLKKDQFEQDKKSYALEQEILKLRGKKEESVRKEISHKKEILNQNYSELAAKEQLDAADKEELQNLINLEQQLKSYTAAQEESIKINSVLGSTVNNLSLSYFNASDAGTSLLGASAKLQSAMSIFKSKTDDASAGTNKFKTALMNVVQSDAANKFRNLFDPLNQFNNELQRASDLAEKVQQSNQDLYRSTGQVTDGSFNLGEQMKRVAMETDSVTIASGEMSKAQIALNESYMDFNSLSQDTINDLSKTNALLDKAGMSARTSAENFTFFVKSMGQTAKEASKNNLKLLDLAQSMKQSPEAIGQAFKQSRSHLAAYGSAFMKHFSKMLGASKKLGIEVGKLLDVGAKLDTIEGAAEASGRLNAMLELRGEDRLDALAIMKASDDEKFAMIAKAMSASKVDLKGGGSDVRGTKRALASAMGMDVADIQKMINSNKGLTLETIRMADIEKNSTKTAKDVDKTNKAAMTSQEKAQKNQELMAGKMTEAMSFLKDALAENTWAVKAGGAALSVGATVAQGIIAKGAADGILKKGIDAVSKKSPLMGKILGGASDMVKSGTPVYVTNFNEMPGGATGGVVDSVLDSVTGGKRGGATPKGGISPAQNIKKTGTSLLKRAGGFLKKTSIRTMLGGLAGTTLAVIGAGVGAAIAGAKIGQMLGPKALRKVGIMKTLGEGIRGDHKKHASGKRRINRQAQSSWDSLSMQQQYNYCSENGKMPPGVGGHCGQVFSKARKSKSQGGIALGSKNKKVQEASAKNQAANKAAGKAKGITPTHYRATMMGIESDAPKVDDFMVNANASDQLIGVKEGGLVANKLDKLIELMSKATAGKEIVIKLDGRTVAKSTISLMNNDFYALG
jgi:plasmid maintenance system antidote protein VapI